VSNGVFTAEVERLIRDHIHSTEQLEILLLLAKTPQQEWSAVAVSRELHRQADSVALRLEAFGAQELVLVRAETPPLYRFNSATREAPAILALDRLYTERKDAVIQKIFATPHDNLRTFSDAFRLRRNDT
jgi:hypothetical protein